MLNEAVINHHNSTHFTVTVSLAFTGGGIISNIILRIDNNNAVMIRIPAVRSPNSNLVWIEDFSITDISLNPEGRLHFLVSVINDYGFNILDVPRVLGKLNKLIL